MATRMSWLLSSVMSALLALGILLVGVPKAAASSSKQVDALQRSELTTTITASYQTTLPLIYGWVSPETALMFLYRSTRGDYWTNNSGWNTSDPYCSWYGITCDSADHITGISLSNNDLWGSIPPEIGGLLDLPVNIETGLCVFPTL